jgi:hypothetical protein
MPLTPNQSLPYPTQDDQLGPEGLEALARAIEGQLVMTFASTADRSARVTVPREGMLCWLQDVNRFERYDGTAWVEMPSLTRVQGLIDAYDKRPKGPVASGFVNTTVALTGTGQLMASATWSCPSSSRMYSWRFSGLFATSTTSPAVAAVGTTVTVGSSPSGGGTQFSDWQVPIVAQYTQGGTRIDLIGRGSSMPTGTMTLGIYANTIAGSGISAYGPRYLAVDDIGS